MRVRSVERLPSARSSVDFLLHLARHVAAALKLPDWLNGLAVGTLGEEAQGIHLEGVGAPDRSGDRI